MKYVLKQTLRLSFDGINVRTYKAGEPYEPAANHERRVFEDLVKGKAEHYYSPSKVSQPKATKVVPPTQEKAPQKPKSAPKSKPKKKKKSE